VSASREIPREVRRIRLAAAADAAAIAMLSRDEIEHGLRWSWTPQRVRRSIEARDTNVVVAEGDTHLVGFALMQYTADDARLLLFGVHPRFRRRGIGTTLIEWLEETVRTAGVGRIQVQVRERNAGARAFYARLGYEPVLATGGYYQGRETAVHLVKELAPGGA
jgi:ribosomal-protein-alanine N-acetyltransferase